MNQKKINIIAILVFMLLASGMLLAKLDAVNVFVDGKKTPARTLVHEGELYISVSDLARVFPNQFTMDAPKKQLDISTAPPSSHNLAPAPPAAGNGIQGEIMLKDRGGMEFPVKGVTVVLFTHNPSISDDMALSSLKRWALGKDNIYSEAHGKIRETKSGADGRFYIGAVPPGTYELTAIYFTVRGKSGRVWRTKISMGKGEPMNVRFDNESAFSLE